MIYNMIFKTFFVVSLFFLTACQNSTQKISWLSQPAPHENKDLGFILSHTSAESIEKLEKVFPNAKIRVISQERGIFAVSGINENEILNTLPRVQLQKNTFLKNLPFKASSVSPPTPTPTRLSSNMPQCQHFDTSTEASKPFQILMTGVKNIENRRLIFPFSSKPLEFTVNQNNGYPLSEEIKVFWMINGPDFFSLNSKIHITKTLSVVPEVSGVYTISLILQNKDNLCVQKKIRFAVSGQESLGPAGEARKISDLNFDENPFSHLLRIGIDPQLHAHQGAGVKIAIIDSGVAYNHPDLRPNILTHHDRVLGWDFVHGNDQPSDDFGHGTIVAGLAAGRLGGVAPLAQIMPIKVLNAFGEGDIASIQAGIFWAIDHGAQIIVAAFGESTPELQKALEPALSRAEEKGVLVVAPAGNHATDLNEHPQYPACSGNANILTVSALDETGAMAAYSNYGDHCVDIATEGGSPLSPNTDPQIKGGLLGPSSSFSMKGLYARQFGTSMAAPIVAGFAALLKAENPDWEAEQIKRAILQRAKKNPLLSGKIKEALTL